VVVTGILTALALQAWWEARSDLTRERIYLDQLTTDLSETERMLMSADSTLAPIIATNSKIVRAFHTPNPPLDSLAPWIQAALFFNEYRPVLGTAEALIASGDLALIRDPVLRSAITKYVDLSRELTLVQHNFSEEWRRGFVLLRSRVDRAELASLTLPASVLDSLARADPNYPLPAGPLRHPFPFAAEEFLRDRDSYDAINAISTGNGGMALMRSLMLTSARALHEQIAAARLLNGRLGDPSDSSHTSPEPQ
jgi:hypothetical protein